MTASYAAFAALQAMVENVCLEVEMGAQLNIKDAETVRLARELADATGQPVTQAIKQALERELARREEEKQAYMDRLREIAREFRAEMPDELRRMTSKEWMDGIYDEDGLPI